MKSHLNESRNNIDVCTTDCRVASSVFWFFSLYMKPRKRAMDHTSVLAKSKSKMRTKWGPILELEDFKSLFPSKFLQKARIYNKWHSATIGLIFIMIRLSCYPISHPTIVTCMEFINIFPVLSLLPYWIIVLGWFWNMVLWGYIIQNQLALVLIWSVLAQAAHVFQKHHMCQNLLNSTIQWR